MLVNVYIYTHLLSIQSIHILYYSDKDRRQIKRDSLLKRKRGVFQRNTTEKEGWFNLYFFKQYHNGQFRLVKAA